MMNESVSPSDGNPNGDYHFTKEIQSMMYAFGDNPVPLQASVNLVEKIVLQQIQLLLHRAADVAVLRGAKCIGIEELLFLMRKDRVKINRLLNYLAVKDMRKLYSPKDLEGCDENGTIIEDPVAPRKKRLTTCLEYLKTIDQTGELSERECQPFDTVKHERNLRAELTSQHLDEHGYLEFSSARRISFKPFQSLRNTKLYDWLLSKSDNLPDLPKQSLAYDILCYLAYETVAQITDLTLLVRQDAAVQPGDAFSYYVAGFTRMPGYYPPQYAAEISGKQAPPPLTPAEIQEALRRYWSPQLCPWSPFSRTVPECINTRLLTC